MNALFALRTVVNLRNTVVGLARDFDLRSQTDIGQHSLIRLFDLCVASLTLYNFVRDGGKDFPKTYELCETLSVAASGAMKIYRLVNNDKRLSTELKVLCLWSIFVDALIVGLYFVPKGPLKEGLRMACLSAEFLGP